MLDDPATEENTMLKTTLLQPEILAALGAAGHGSRILIADGNYPMATRTGPSAVHVFLNLSPGIVTVPQVLRAIVDIVPIEAYAIMQPPPEVDASILREFEQMLPDVPCEPLERFAFYDAASSDQTALAIATGEQRVYANILLTIGVVK
jgi:L-fucose mutarotase